MKKTVKNIYSYFQGWFRYSLYYSKYLHILLPKYLKEQIFKRINSVEYNSPECLSSGSCIKCGCKTTALQMANKACEGKCYPRMLSKKEYEEFSNLGVITIDNQIWERRYVHDKNISTMTEIFKLVADDK